MSAITEPAGFPPGLGARKVFGIAPAGCSMPDDEMDMNPILDESEARAALSSGERLFSRWLTDWVLEDPATTMD